MLPRVHHALILILSATPLGLFASPTDPDRDFAGVWLLDEPQSDFRALASAPAAILNISQQGATLTCTESDRNGRTAAVWIYHTDSTPTKYPVGDARMSSLAKWEGSALLINTMAAGPQNYAISDRWRLSRDRNVLTIKRQIQRGMSESDAVLVYRNQLAREGPKDVPAQAPRLTNPPAPAPDDVVVPAGTKIPLALVNSISTKHSHEGDRVYLETAFPVTVNGRVIIPRGSYVISTLTEVKKPGKVKGRGELFLRFDSLTLPNGVTRDFRSRLSGSDTGELDREEGKIKGEGNKAGDARTIGEATGIGAAVGTVAGSAAGHAGMGAGVGAAAGAAAGLAGVLFSRGPDLVLPKGTSVEMVLDRDVRFKMSELHP